VTQLSTAIYLSTLHSDFCASWGWEISHHGLQPAEKFTSSGVTRISASSGRSIEVRSSPPPESRHVGLAPTARFVVVSHKIFHKIFLMTLFRAPRLLRTGATAPCAPLLTPLYTSKGEIHRGGVRGINQQWERLTFNLLYPNSHPELEYSRCSSGRCVVRFSERDPAECPTEETV